MIYRAISRIVLVPTKRHEIDVSQIKRPAVIQADEISSVFTGKNLYVTIFKADHAKVSVLPLSENKRRKLLFAESGRNGLRIFYYSDNINRVFIAKGEQFISLERDQLFNVHRALRRFTQNARPDLSMKPGKPLGSKYVEPP
jgi:hypothetical protein